MKKVLSLILVAIFALSMVACGAPGHDFVCADVVNASAGQQRWLRSFESNLVVNPEAIGAEQYTDAEGKLGLDLGILDAEGNIAKILNDVLFVIEPYYANGVGGETVFLAIFEGEGVNTSGLKDVAYNGSEGQVLNITGGDKSFSVKSAKTQITLDNITEYYIICRVGSIVKGENLAEKDKCQIKIQGTMNNPLKTEDFAKVTVPGNYIFKINDVAFTEEIPEGTVRKFTPLLAFEKGCQYVINEFSIKTFADGGAYATEDMRNIWYPYQITSTQEFNNGTALTTEDMITDLNSVTRSFTVDMDGAMYLAGSLNGGSAEYADEILTVKGEGYEFSVSCTRRGDMLFFDSEEDMLAGVNGTAEPTATSQYWVLAIGSVLTSETFNVGITASITGEATAEAAQDASRSATVKKFKANAETKWNEFIASNNVEDYIEDIPEGK